MANLAFGVRITGPQNTVGGLLAASRTSFPVTNPREWFLDQATASENVVMATGSVSMQRLGSLAQSHPGGVDQYARDQQYGGGNRQRSGECYFWQSFSGLLIDINATNNLVAGNLIGTNRRALLPWPTSRRCANQTRRTTPSGARCPGTQCGLGNSSTGITLQTLADNSVVLGNWVGLNAAGNAAMGNGAAGVSVYATAAMCSRWCTRERRRQCDRGQLQTASISARQGPVSRSRVT